MTDKEFRERFFEIKENIVNSSPSIKGSAYRIYEFLIAIEILCEEFEDEKDETLAPENVDLDKFDDIQIPESQPRVDATARWDES